MKPSSKRTKRIARVRWQSDAYNAIENAVRKAAEQDPTAYSNWCYLDLGEGNVLTFVWLGKKAELKKLRRQFDKILDDGLMLYSQNSEPSKIVAAIRRGLSPKKRPMKTARRKTARQKSKKAVRS